MKREPQPVTVTLTQMDMMEICHDLTKARRTRRFVIGWPWGSNFILALWDEFERFGFAVGRDRCGRERTRRRS